MTAGTGAVMVTGAASGLGGAVVEAVERLGLTPVGVDRVEGPGEHHIVADVTDRGSMEAAVGKAAGIGTGLVGVVTAAGIDRCGRLEDVDADEWDRVISVNLLGTVNTVRAALPHLERTGGRVVTVASTLGLRAVSDATAYCASKFGVVGFTRALTLELAGRVGVTLLVPGGMRTSFFDDRTEQYKPGPDAELAAPSAIADVVASALRMPAGVELRELVVTPSREPSWP